MSFPDHKILPADKSYWLSAAFEQKKIEFSPFKICSFYSEFEVIQIQGEESKEYFLEIITKENIVGTFILVINITRCKLQKFAMCICQKIYPSLMNLRKNMVA